MKITDRIKNFAKSADQAIKKYDAGREERQKKQLKRLKLETKIARQKAQLNKYNSNKPTTGSLFGGYEPSTPQRSYFDTYEPPKKAMPVKKKKKRSGKEITIRIK